MSVLAILYITYATVTMIVGISPMFISRTRLTTNHEPQSQQLAEPRGVSAATGI